MADFSTAIHLNGDDVGRTATALVDGHEVVGRVKSIRFDEPAPGDRAPIVYLTLYVHGLTLFGRVPPGTDVKLEGVRGG